MRPGQNGADRATLCGVGGYYHKGVAAFARDRPGKSEFVGYRMNLLKRLARSDLKLGNAPSAANKVEG